MSKRLFTAILAAICFLAFTVIAEAQPMRGWKGSGGWGAGTQYQRMYNPATVETISGEIASVDKITMMRGMSYGIHLQLKTDKETISVHLGPGWFIERQDIKLAAGDKITITGSRITFGNSPAIIAAELKKGDQTLLLRDKAGFPVWSGWRMR